MFADEIVLFLTHGVIVQNNNGERQVESDCGVEVRDVHHEGGVGGHVGDPLARASKACSDCDR